MSDFVEIEWTSGSLDEARRVSRYLVQERLVANAKITPWVETIFMLNNQLDTMQESCITYIADKNNLAKIIEIIQQNSKYQVPEITWETIEGGNEGYLEWLTESLGKRI